MEVRISLTRWKIAFDKLCVDALPAYMMSLCLAPTRIVDKLDAYLGSIGRKFLWKGNKDKKGYHLVKLKVNEKRFW